MAFTFLTAEWRNLIFANYAIDRRVLERPGNVAIDPAPANPEMMKRLKAWAKAGTVAGNHLWMQISHAGRQSPMSALHMVIVA